MAVLIVAMVVGMYWIDATLEYAAPMHIVAIAALTVIAMIASMQIVGLTLISQKWVDEVEIVDAEFEEELGEAAEWTTSDELKDIRELVEWKSTQMASIETYAIERLDDLQAQINKLGDLKNYDFAGHAQTIKELHGRVNGLQDK
tara:strand:- start:110 stop:544 length:435 start_codon:yes stop_codon:yes gene_type:complete